MNSWIWILLLLCCSGGRNNCCEVSRPQSCCEPCCTPCRQEPHSHTISCGSERCTDTHKPMMGNPCSGDSGRPVAPPPMPRTPMPPYDDCGCN